MLIVLFFTRTTVSHIYLNIRCESRVRLHPVFASFLIFLEQYHIILMVGSNLPPPLFLRRIQKTTTTIVAVVFLCYKKFGFFCKILSKYVAIRNIYFESDECSKNKFVKILINGLSKSNLCYFLKTFFTVNLFLFNIQFLSSLRIQIKHKLLSTYHGEDSRHQWLFPFDG